jgi:hypothetical protein
MGSPGTIGANCKDLSLSMQTVSHGRIRVSVIGNPLLGNANCRNRAFALRTDHSVVGAMGIFQ